MKREKKKLEKIQLITCKNSSRKPVKSMVPRGYRRNGSKLKALKRMHQICTLGSDITKDT